MGSVVNLFSRRLPGPFAACCLIGLVLVIAGGARPDTQRVVPSADTPKAETPESGTPEAETPKAETPRREGESTGETGRAAEADPSGASDRDVPVAVPLLSLALGVALVLGLIIGFKVNAFLALIVAAMAVSLVAGGSPGERIQRVADAFGSSAGKIGIVIALAAVIGKCMLDSGAADRIVRSFLAVFGEKRAPTALMGSGFVLAIPVFFATVFYLLVPLARSLFRRTRVHYLFYVLAIAVGGAITHTLVPPTPGPLVMADNLEFPVGVMIMIGAMVAAPAALVGLVFAGLLDRWMPVEMRPLGTGPESKPLAENELPSLSWSLAPVVLPVVLISANTVFSTWTKADPSSATLKTLFQIFGVLGNANLALLMSAAIALVTLKLKRRLDFGGLASVVETALMSGGVIILITASGGAFGAMLKTAGVGLAIEHLFQGVAAAGVLLLLLGFTVAAVLKIAQGSSTVAMITGSGMLAGIAHSGTLGFHPVYLATAIGAGSLFGSWMNDSGFWIFAKMSGLTEIEALKSWTPTLIVLSVTALVVTMLLASFMPFPPFTEMPSGAIP